MSKTTTKNTMNIFVKHTYLPMNYYAIFFLILASLFPIASSATAVQAVNFYDTAGGRCEALLKPGIAFPNPNLGIGYRGFLGSSPAPTPEAEEALQKFGIEWWRIEFYVVASEEAAIQHAKSLEARAIMNAHTGGTYIIDPSMADATTSDVLLKMSPKQLEDFLKNSIQNRRIYWLHTERDPQTNVGPILKTWGEYLDPQTASLLIDPSRATIANCAGMYGHNIRITGWVKPSEYGVISIESTFGAFDRARRAIRKAREDGASYHLVINQETDPNAPAYEANLRRFQETMELLKKQVRLGGVTQTDANGNNVTDKVALDQSLNRFATDPELVKSTEQKFLAGNLLIAEKRDANGKLLGVSLASWDRGTNKFVHETVGYANENGADKGAIDHAREVSLFMLARLAEAGIRESDIGMLTTFTQGLRGQVVSPEEYNRLMSTLPKGPLAIDFSSLGPLDKGAPPPPPENDYKPAQPKAITWYNDLVRHPARVLLGNKPIAIIVAGYSSGADLAQHLKDTGYTLVHIHPHRRLPPALSPSFEQNNYAHDFTYNGDFSNLLKKLEGLNVKAVLTGTETGVELTDRLNAYYKFPGNDPSLSKARNNKYLMHAAIREKGLRAIPDFQSNKIEEILAWIQDPNGNNNRWPVVIKPLDSAGTNGVHICENEEEVRAAFKKLLGGETMFRQPIQTVLAQSFINGTEIVINTVSSGGRHLISDAYKYTKVKVDVPGGGKSNIYLNNTLLAFDHPFVEMNKGYAFAVLDALGIKEGPAHMEIMITPEGPILIEVGARIMGGHPHYITGKAIQDYHGNSASSVELVRLATFDPYRFQDIARHGLTMRANGFEVDLVSTQTGKITAIQMDEIKRLPSYVHSLMPKIGSELVATTDLLTSPGTIYLVHPDPEQIAKDYQRIRELEAQNAIFTVKERNNGGNNAKTK